MTNDEMRSQLEARKSKLTSAIGEQGHSDQLARLLRQVDDALTRIENGTFGLCETCGDAIEPERLAVDPLIRYCLDHLTESEQRLLQHDLDLAYHVQTSLLPKQGTRIGEWSVVHHFEAAGPVGGDYIDIVPLKEEPGAFLFLMGDVTGKGVAAAFLMSQLHAIFRTLSHLNLSIGELLSQANRLFCEGTTSRYFATLVCGKVSASGVVEMVNAGHCSPVVLQADTIRTIRSSGLPLGLFCDGTFRPTKIETSPGDTLILYTDGLIESRNPADDLYGEERLLALLQRESRRASEELLKACLDDVKTFRATAPRIDDAALMVLRRSHRQEN